jgi:UDP-2,3-diacylglucosamine pyrophosphatase LpxH
MELRCETARSVFLSDLHLGWRLSKPDLALEFLSQCSPRYLYLVGDTFEGLHGPLNFRSATAVRFWDALRRLSERGTEIAILTGNHDSALAGIPPEVPCRHGAFALHTTLCGERFLVTHGDIFEHMESTAHTPVRQFGSWVYPRLVQLGDVLQRIRIPPGNRKRHWCTYWKLKIRRARAHIHAFERAMVELADRYGCDGVVCGHIHRPDRKRLSERWYFNCGDWVEHRSCVVETYDGRMQLIHDLTFTCSSSETP